MPRRRAAAAGQSLTYLMQRVGPVFFNGGMDDFERLYDRWQLANLCLWAYMAEPAAASPFIRDFLLAQLRQVTDDLLRALWDCVRQKQRALPLL